MVKGLKPTSWSGGLHSLGWLVLGKSSRSPTISYIFDDGGDDRQSSVMPISALRWFRTRTYDFVRWGACYVPAIGTVRPPDSRYGFCLLEQRRDGRTMLLDIVHPKRMTEDDRNSIDYEISQDANIPRSWSL